ncbi:MAG: heme ABC exporter ATP-binding protein CcmA [Mesorhizobium sp.]|uniref:heme ABC exporter ATP-binding protein CcmA n=1 Tax=Mesorhizobium sp. TaxID=1871066 RepID=UPI000FE5F0F1|nr:heme ABC exporter ATP-binding protein CcmA [Mesorhizobium sp.]RWC88198.1 MAG: heme ABC exporter ATP-binding protein CcmA [Mesorhizobium sp.]
MRLIAENLGGERGGEAVFSGIGFALETGQALVVTGPNGSGKSACHYLGHQNAMKTALSVAENLRFWREFHGEGRLGVEEALETVGLGGIGHLPFGYLSTGQRRRAAIAKLLVSHRPLWLLDEPTAGLDKASEGRFAGLMQEYCAEGGMIVAATHLPLGLEGARELQMRVGH